MNALDDYLATYAEPDFEALAFLTAELEPSLAFDDGVLIPSRGEGRNLLLTLQSLSEAALGPTCVVVILNGSQNEQTSNEESYQALVSWAEATSTSHNLSLCTHGLLSILIIRFERLELSQSCVGWARKVGADLLVRLYHIKKLRSPWIRSLDADCLVSRNYFDDLHEVRKLSKVYKLDEVHKLNSELAPDRISAFTFHLCHQEPDEPVLKRAIADYEFFLHYYRDGLSYAGSPYAFLTVGSAFAFHAHAYAEVRGFPQRQAGEDFYLLNKLRKRGQIAESNALVRPQARLSQRVPFGTGPALKAIEASYQAGQPYLVYHPDCFQQLRRLLIFLRQWAIRDHGTLSEAVHKLPAETRPENSVIYRLEAALSGRKNPANRLHTLHEAFDGFSSLRFIHGCNALYPRVSIESLREFGGSPLRYPTKDLQGSHSVIESWYERNHTPSTLLVC